MASYRNIKFDGAHTLISQPEVHMAGNSDLTWRFTSELFQGIHICDRVDFFMDGELMCTSRWGKAKTQAFLDELKAGEVYYVDHSELPLAS
jgi:hypothetical protein